MCLFSVVPKKLIHTPDFREDTGIPMPSDIAIITTINRIAILTTINIIAIITTTY